MFMAMWPTEGARRTNRGGLNLSGKADSEGTHSARSGGWF